MRTLHPCVAIAAALTVMAAGCQRGGDLAAGTGAQQTQLPGQVTAGGATSGAIMEQAKGANAKDMGAAARQAGTPGIPEGSGGTTAGARMGGTVPHSVLSDTGEKSPAQQAPGQAASASAVSGSAAPPAASAAAPSASAAAVAAERQKQLLDERMTRVAQRWHERERSGALKQTGAVPITPPASAAPR